MLVVLHTLARLCYCEKAAAAAPLRQIGSKDASVVHLSLGRFSPFVRKPRGAHTTPAALRPRGCWCQLVASFVGAGHHDHELVAEMALRAAQAARTQSTWWIELPRKLRSCSREIHRLDDKSLNAIDALGTAHALGARPARRILDGRRGGRSSLNADGLAGAQASDAARRRPGRIGERRRRRDEHFSGNARECEETRCVELHDCGERSGAGRSHAAVSEHCRHAGRVPAGRGRRLAGDFQTTWKRTAQRSSIGSSAATPSLFPSYKYHERRASESDAGGRPRTGARERRGAGL